jgi:hypothetical protein
MSKLKQFFKGFGKGFKDFGHNISRIVNSLLLIIVYFIGAGITAIVAKITGKHFLEHKYPGKEKTKAKSYWKELDLKKKSIEQYYRQF